MLLSSHKCHGCQYYNTVHWIRELNEDLYITGDPEQDYEKKIGCARPTQLIVFSDSP